MMVKWIKRLIGAFALILIIVIFLLHISSSYFRFSNSNVPSDIEIVSHQYNGKDTRYLKFENATSDKLVVFVHGAPGSAGDLCSYLQSDTLQKSATLISIDRLGYGYNDYGQVASISQQVAFLNDIVSKEGEDKDLYLVGHSYGGPIAASYADNHKAEGILLLAAVIDPYNEKIFWFSYFTFWNATKWLFPKYIKVAGAEKESHENELLKIKDIWSELEVPVFMVHDTSDFIAPGIENIKWAKEHVTDSLFNFQVSNDDHFIPFVNEELTTSMIFKLINNKSQN